MDSFVRKIQQLRILAVLPFRIQIKVYYEPVPMFIGFANRNISVLRVGFQYTREFHRISRRQPQC